MGAKVNWKIGSDALLPAIDLEELRLYSLELI